MPTHPTCKKSFASQVVKNNARIYDLRSKTESGHPFFHFVLVDPLKEKALLRIIERDGTFNAKEFGEIIASGWGEPSPELKQEMFEKYGLTYDE